VERGATLGRGEITMTQKGSGFVYFGLFCAHVRKDPSCVLPARLNGGILTAWVVTKIARKIRVAQA
jgi:hypothetical protein